MKLEFPNESYKDRYIRLIEEWWKIENLSEMSPWALFIWDNFEEFLKLTNEYKINSPTWVNSSLYFIINETKDLVWAIQGHIWYWIAPKFRRKWYASEALKLILLKAKEKWINKILITAIPNNIWSIKIIEKNWWVFERIWFIKDYWEFNRYWINL